MRATALKLLVSTACLLLAVRGMHVADLVTTMVHAGPGWVVGSIVLLALSHVVASVRWWLLLRGNDLDVSLPATLRLFFLGLFFTNVLPSGFGGDAVRSVVLGRRSGQMGVAAASVLVDRLASVWALVGLGVLALFVAPGHVPDEIVVSMGVSAAAVLGGSLLLLAREPIGWFSRHGRPAVVRRLAGSAATALGVYRRRPALLGTALALSVVGQVLVAVGAWMLARGLGLDVGLLVLAAAIPVALLATAVPTSINGLGVREAVFRSLLVPAGVLAQDAVAFSLATVVIGAIVSLPGALVWALDRRGARDDASSELNPRTSTPLAP